MEGIAVLRRMRGALIPANDDAVAMIEKIGIGEEVTCKLEQPRSLPELRWYWAMLGHVGEAIGMTKDELHAELRRHLGHFITRQRKNGEPYVELLSTSFPEMGQAEYHNYVVKAREAVASFLGMTVDQLSDEVCREKGVPPIPRPSAGANADSGAVTNPSRDAGASPEGRGEKLI